MRDVLVTKATGTTGRYVVERLAERGASVKAASRNPSSVTQGNVVPILFDWENRSTWDAALDGTDAVYLVKPESPEVTQIIFDFIELAKSFGVIKIVLLSEIAAETRTADADELKVERVVEQSGLTYTILRPNWFMQDLVDERFFGDLIRRDGVIVMTTGGAATAWIDARDIAAVAVEILLGADYDKQALTLTGPDAFTLVQLTDRIAAVTGTVVQPVEETTQAAEERLRKSGASEGFIEYFSNIGRSIMKGDTASVADQVALITGREPRTLDAFLTEYAPLLQRGAGQ
ncbi:NAD(P)H-binding protein (plasmid) [Sphingobium fuliginis]|uniref:NAD(P)H-binding protein n=1 Tax=Sphingobium fuliginis (strain ATCC 27551) TaxID=336203 RepID=A0A7M2GQR0_SPHSA|nr:NAD(P)H-binding protein [Sphingobium fuliginis]QOT74497.1 NAD(P)H-binding protein [Sphingobium fuliginis]